MKRHILSLAFWFIALLAIAPPAFAGTLNILTDKTQFAIGDEFSIDIKIDSENASINAAQATVNYPVGILQETGVDKTNSVFSFWLQEPATDNTGGKVSFIGGSSSGITGKTLQALRISFKVVGSGTADISFGDGAITAADGNGTNVLSVMNGLSITSISKQQAALIPAPKIPAVTLIKREAVPTGKIPVKPRLNIPLYPTMSGWYNSQSTFIVHWQLPIDVTGVATALDQKPVSDIKTSEGLFDNKTFPRLPDGVWYLHIRFKNDVGWGPVTDYKIGIDTAPPLPFEVSIQEGVTTYVESPTIAFKTDDQPSGIAAYRILIDNIESTSTILTSYTLPSLSYGKHTVVVQAEDFSGNKTSTKLEVKILERPFLVVGALSLTQFQFFAIMITILLGIFTAWWFSYRTWEKQLERRILVAERDVGDTLSVIAGDVEKILVLVNEDHLSVKDVNEVGFLAKKIKEKIGKAKKYIIDNIREISQK